MKAILRIRGGKGRGIGEIRTWRKEEEQEEEEKGRMNCKKIKTTRENRGRKGR